MVEIKHTNQQIASMLRNVAASYQLQDQNKYRFQIISYNNAADSIEHATSELKDLWDDGKLSDIAGIGPSLESHLDELFKSGKSKHFEKIMKGIDPRVFILMELPKIGIKTAVKLIKESSRGEIDKLIEEAERKQIKNKRHLLPYAQTIASEIIEWLETSSDVAKIDVLGSLRRKVATIGDIDMLVSTNNPSSVMDKFISYPKVQKVIEKGEHTASIIVPGGVQVDLLVSDENSYGSALQHFTGSKNHNIALREYSLKKNLSLSEYGIKDKKTNKLNTFKTEEDFYNHLGLAYIEPELREDSGEIIAAQKRALPELITLKDVKADLQIHSNFDIETSHDLGVSTMSEIVKSAINLNYEYIAFSEHNPSRGKHSQKEIVEILKKKKKEVDVINYSREKFKNNRVYKVFNSLEIDILQDGSLPVPDAGMDTLDFALVSIHSSFDQPKDVMTERVVKALSHPKVKVFAHPTARKINEREGIELDWEKIFEFCVKNNKWLEIDADPMRLDLPDILVREAVKRGIKLTLGTDAHHVDHLRNMEFGVNIARRGWCEKKNMINCMGLIEFEKELKRGD